MNLCSVWEKCSIYDPFDPAPSCCHGGEGCQEKILIEYMVAANKYYQRLEAKR